MVVLAHGSMRSFVQQHPFVGLALSIVLIVGIIWLVEGGRVEEPTAQASVVTLTGFQGGTTPQVGAPAPNFTLESLDGRQVSLAELRGRPILINFWATWCPPCRAEMPDLQEVSRAYENAGLVVLGLNLQESRDDVQRYADTLGLTFPLLLDRDGVVATHYNLTALPTSYFIDRDGIVRDRYIGPLTAKGLRSKVAKIVD
jgi:cytochrome c biogenesis protein CcmG, thiol:disulfide interchange protein DsbE